MQHVERVGIVHQHLQVFVRATTGPGDEPRGDDLRLHHPRSHIWRMPLRPCSEVTRAWCQLPIETMEKREAIHDDFNVTLIKLLWEGNVEVSNQNVRGTRPPALWLLRSLMRSLVAPARPHLRTLRGDGQGRRVDGHTGMYAKWGQREPEATEKEHPQDLGVKARVESCRTTHEGQTSHGSSLGPQHGPVLIWEPRPHRCGQKGILHLLGCFALPPMSRHPWASVFYVTSTGSRPLPTLSNWECGNQHPQICLRPGPKQRDDMMGDLASNRSE